MRYLVKMCAVLMILCLLSTSVFLSSATSEKASINAEFDASTYAVGSIATVNITAYALSGTFDLGGFQFTLNNPPGMVLQSITMDPTGAFTRGETPVGIAESSVDTSAGALCQVGSKSLEVGTEGFILAQAKYLVSEVDEGMPWIGLKTAALSDENGDKIGAFLTGDMASIQPYNADAPAFAITIDGQNEKICMSGDEVTVSLTLCGSDKTVSFCSIQDTIRFDPTCFSFVEDSITTGFGSAISKTTGDAVDRVLFSAYGTETRLVNSGSIICSFRLKILKAGMLTHSGAILTDENATTLPFCVKNASVVSFASGDGVSVMRIGENEIRNFSDAAVNFISCTATYGEKGQLDAVSTLDSVQLASGETYTLPMDKSLIPERGYARIFVMDEHFEPILSYIIFKVS